jgi:hypothetical protein
MEVEGSENEEGYGKIVLVVKYRFGCMAQRTSVCRNSTCREASASTNLVTRISEKLSANIHIEPQRFKLRHFPTYRFIFHYAPLSAFALAPSVP